MSTKSIAADAILALVESLGGAVIRVVETMAGAAPRRMNPYLMTDRATKGDITAVMGLVSPNEVGAFAVSFQLATIAGIAEAMLGEAPDGPGELEDAAGEICNMVSGAARAALPPERAFEMAIPTVVTGKGHSVFQMSDLPGFVIPFETDHGPFHIAVVLKRRH